MTYSFGITNRWSSDADETISFLAEENKRKESHTTDKKQILDYECMHVKKQSSKF